MDGRVIVFESAGKTVLKPFKVQQPGPGQVLVETAYSVVSAGTERDNLLNRPNTSDTFPYYPGYSSSGRVTAVGPGVESLAVGDRVVQYFLGHRSHTLSPAAKLTRIEDGVDLLDAAFVPIGSMGLQGLRKLRIELGEAVLVTGLGILGMFATQAAALAGAIPLIVVDFNPNRRETALAIGADYAFSPDDDDLQEKVRGLTGGRGPAGVVEASGSAAALRLALELVAREGRVTLLGCTRVSDADIDFYQQIHRPGVSLIGAHTFVRPAQDSRPGYWTIGDDFQTLLAFLAAKRLRVEPLISEILPPAEAPAAYDRLATASPAPLGIVFDWSRSE